MKRIGLGSWPAQPVGGAAVAPAEIVRELGQQRPVAARAGREVGRQAERVLPGCLVAGEREAGGHGQAVAAHQQLDVGDDPRVAGRAGGGHRRQPAVTVGQPLRVRRVDGCAGVGDRGAAVALRPALDLVDVPGGVVVGEDRAVPVGGRPAGLRGSGRRRGSRRSGSYGLVAVELPSMPVSCPTSRAARRSELHRPARAGAVGAGVHAGQAAAAVVGLDLADRGQVLPADAVGGAGGLVRAQVQRRDVGQRGRRRGVAVDGAARSASRRARRRMAAISAISASGRPSDETSSHSSQRRCDHASAPARAAPAAASGAAILLDLRDDPALAAAVDGDAASRSGSRRRRPARAGSRGRCRRRRPAGDATRGRGLVGLRRRHARRVALQLVAQLARDAADASGVGLPVAVGQVAGQERARRARGLAHHAPLRRVERLRLGALARTLAAGGLRRAQTSPARCSRPRARSLRAWRCRRRRRPCRSSRRTPPARAGWPARRSRP